MKIGENIRKLRLKSGFTQEQLAVRLGVTFQAVSKWENGANTPDISLLPALASVFGVTIDSLFSDGDTAAWTGAEMIKDDGVLRVVQLQGTRVLRASPLSGDDPSFEIVFPRNCNDRAQYFKVEVFGRLIADGPINGDVVCHENVYCDDINGDVTCGCSLKCDDLNGNLQCAGNIECGSISGNVTCGGCINASTIRDCTSTECRISIQPSIPRSGQIT